MEKGSDLHGLRSNLRSVDSTLSAKQAMYLLEHFLNKRDVELASLAMACIKILTSRWPRIKVGANGSHVLTSSVKVKASRLLLSNTNPLETLAMCSKKFEEHFVLVELEVAPRKEEEQ